MTKAIQLQNIKKNESKIYKKFNTYFALRKRREREYTEEISNFTLTIEKTIFESVGSCIRYVYFINNLNQSSDLFKIEPKTMVRSNLFKLFCWSKGNFIWKGNNRDLMAVWEHEFIDEVVNGR